MKKLQLLFPLALACLFLTTTLSAQVQRTPIPDRLKKAVPAKKLHDFPVPVAESAATDPALDTRGTELDVTIGTTVYDLQTNYSVCNRMSEDADGNIVGVWTMGFNSGDGYSDRGTGYNRRDAGTGLWMDEPTERLEDGVRTGWPNHVFTESGTEFIVNHVFTAGEYRLHTLRREAGEVDWTESDIPSDVPIGVLWPRAAQSGENVHVIAISTPVGDLGGQLYEGMSAHPLYYRSSDGGATWEVTDFIIPGLDSTWSYDLISADAYAIDARGDKVVVGVFSQWNDLLIATSEDGGDTWSTTRIFDFPLDKYEINSGYAASDLPVYDTLLGQPDTLAIFTSDNCGHVMIDREGKAHAFYGEMWVQDADLADAGWTYYPATSGLSYWNESMGADSTRLVADILDLNGDDIINIASINNLGLYFMSMTSMASAACDDANNLYLAYSMVMESEEYIDDEDDQHMRHIWIINSQDGGETWSEPYNIVNEETVGDINFTFFIEAVFPHMLRDIGGNIRLIYQQDFVPGLALRGDMDLASENNIQFTQITSLIGTGDTYVPAKEFSLEVTPNPVSDIAIIDFELKGQSQVNLDLFDSNGQNIRSIATGKYDGGVHQVELPVAGLAPGMYFVRMQSNMTSTVVKIVVE